MSKKGGTTDSHNVPAVPRTKEEKEAALDALVARIESNDKYDKFTDDERLAMWIQHQQRQQQIAYATHIQRLREQHEEQARLANEPVPLPEAVKEWTSTAPGKWVRYAQFDGSDEQTQFIIALYDKELSEPYSTFTYEYFIFGWKDLCILAFGMESETKPKETDAGAMIGAVVSRVSRKSVKRPWVGYIAMLAVLPTFRGGRIGSKLVTISADLMRKKGCEQVSLETPVTNARALKLYTDLGFAKVKFLPVYYLDGSDAVRLKLFLEARDPQLPPSQEEQEDAATAAVEKAAAAAQ